MWVKICGITSLEDALTASTFGADAVGFVFADSPRRVTLETARSISLGMPAGPKRVGVFVDSPLEEVQETIRYCGLDLVQLHGTESPEYCSELRDKAIKAIRVRGTGSVAVSDPEGLKAAREDIMRLLRASPAVFGDRTRAIIAGGLRPLNLAHAIDLARPYGVDVSSGVEVEPGRKDPVLMYEFIEKARKADFEVSRC